jgi:catechol 2,3-dioxygenase-like lactoylglutathione lyase family enzyme
VTHDTDPNRQARINVRAVDHIGITVPSIDDALQFFSEAFGAQVLFGMESSYDPNADPTTSTEHARLGTRPTSRWTRSLPLKLGEGASVELFEYHDPERLPPPTASDLGIQHFAVYVDDMDIAVERVVAAGGTALEGPSLLPGPESGEGNKWIYTIAPWGGIIELVSYPSPQAFEQTTDVRRWRPFSTT